ncbi:MAG: hypothetical protein Q7K39_01655 [Candidatus Magasanikbacteria bacterium]|nr:hypothetical protein [Candidatus Magasanikbacteria bacterium]
MALYWLQTLIELLLCRADDFHASHYFCQTFRISGVLRDGAFKIGIMRRGVMSDVVVNVKSSKSFLAALLL